MLKLGIYNPSREDGDPPMPTATKTKTDPPTEARKVGVSVFNPRTVTPPTRKTGPKGSPYIDPEKVPAVAAMAKDGWTSPIDPLDSESKALTAVRRWRDAVANHHNIPTNAVATRKWEVNDKGEATEGGGLWVIAIVIKSGAIPA